MMRKKIILLFIYFIFFIVLNKPIYALGLSSEADKRISYEPGLERTFEFLVQHTTRDVQIIVGGYPVEYATLSRDFIKANDPDKSFHVTIKFPETTLKPGHHQIKVQANEVVGEEGAIATSINIATHIDIDVLYSGKYAEVRFDEANTINNTAYFTISANNFGLSKIESFKARIEIYNSDGYKVGTVYTDEKSIESDKRETIKAELDVSGYDVGDYKAKAFVFWDDNQTTVEEVFRVGALKINIIDYTKEFIAGAINKFEVKLENVWTDEIKDVYVIVKINNEELRSAAESIAQFGTKTFNVYWDTTNIKPGEYNVEITAHYLDKTTMEIGTVKIIEKESEVKLEKAKTGFPLFTIALIAIILLIIIIDLIWMKYRKKE